MKSLNDMMRELGFNPNAPAETQKAFIKNLIRSAQDLSPVEEERSRHVSGTAADTKMNQTDIATDKLDQGLVQLAFDLSDDKRVS